MMMRKFPSPAERRCLTRLSPRSWAHGILRMGSSRVVPVLVKLERDDHSIVSDPSSLRLSHFAGGSLPLRPGRTAPEGEPVVPGPSVRQRSPHRWCEDVYWNLYARWQTLVSCLRLSRVISDSVCAVFDPA